MSSPVFVRDAVGKPLMPTSPAYARRLLQRGKARWMPHHAFPIIQLTQVVTLPVLRPVTVGIHIHMHMAELIVVADGDLRPFPLLRLAVDLRTDLPIRIRRRAGHRRRRRARGRYRPMRRYGQPFKLRRPSLARSAWSRVVRPRLRRAHGSRPWSVSPTLRWRARAIERVITALQTFLPVSHIVILAPRQLPGSVDPTSTASLRERLINAYGQVTADGTRVAMCAYCGTTEGRIEVDHVFPKSRGGTDRWSNRVLACATCNAQKGDRTPEEAGMPLRISAYKMLSRPNRAGVYPQQTARVLVHNLCGRGISVSWPGGADTAWEDDTTSFISLTVAMQSWPPSIPIMVARPIARPSKQNYSARNYPLSTAQRVGYVRVGTTIKRRIQVNQALVIREHPKRHVEAIPANIAMPNDGGQIVRLGMLCEGMRGEQRVTGVVAAIHSSGRLTLLTPGAVRDQTIAWHRIIVSPRKHLRVLSTDRVIFLAMSDM